MNIYDKLVKKYGTPKTVILPPPSEEEGDFSIKTDPNDMGDSFRALLHGDQLDPLTEAPSQSQEDILKELSQSESEPPPAYETELLKALRPEFYSSDKDAPTRPPPKKASYDSDHIMRLCKQYHDLCCKL